MAAFSQPRHSYATSRARTLVSASITSWRAQPGRLGAGGSGRTAPVPRGRQINIRFVDLMSVTKAGIVSPPLLLVSEREATAEAATASVNYRCH